MPLVLLTSNSITTFLYMFIGIVGYLAFLDKTNGNILLNFGYNLPIIIIARIGMALSVSLTYPLVLFPLRFTIDDLIFGGKQSTTLRHVLETIILVLLSYGIATAIPVLSIVFGISGSICAMLTNFILPSALYWKIVACKEDSSLVSPVSRFHTIFNHLRSHSFWIHKLPALLLLLAGIVCGAVSTTVITIGAIKRLSGHQSSP